MGILSLDRFEDALQREEQFGFGHPCFSSGIFPRTPWLADKSDPCWPSPLIVSFWGRGFFWRTCLQCWFYQMVQAVSFWSIFSWTGFWSIEQGSIYQTAKHLPGCRSNLWMTTRDCLFVVHFWKRPCNAVVKLSVSKPLWSYQMGSRLRQVVLVGNWLLARPGIRALRYLSRAGDLRCWKVVSFYWLKLVDKFDEEGLEGMKGQEQIRRSEFLKLLCILHMSLTCFFKFLVSLCLEELAFWGIFRWDNLSKWFAAWLTDLERVVSVYRLKKGSSLCWFMFSGCLGGPGYLDLVS